VVSPNATVGSSNATKVSPDATVYSGQIERDRNPDRREMESDKYSPALSPAARPVESSNFDTEGLERAKAFYPVPDISRDPLILVESSTVPCNEEISVPANSTAPVNFPRFLKDEFPGWMPELKAEVQRLKNALKTPIEPVHPDLLPFDVIIDWERHCWIESELQINPLTDMPIDWGNFDEQIDVAVDELGIESFFDAAYSKKDMLEFREHFKRHEGLSIPMIRKMLERIADACQLPAFRSSKKEKVDHYYFARIIKDLKTFNRYFKQLFRETFAPFVNEQGEARFEEEGRMRWWPKGEEIWAEDFEYPLCESPENMPEPFRSILAKDVEQEGEKLLRIGALQRTLQDGQDNGEIEAPPTDQDSLSGPEVNAFWRAKETVPEECEVIRRTKLQPTNEESIIPGYPSMEPKAEEAFEEHTAMWYLMKKLGSDATGKIPVASLSGFPAMESKQGDSQSSDPDIVRSMP